MLIKTKPIRSQKRKPKSLSGLKKKAWDLLSQCIRREYAQKNNGVCDCYTCPATLTVDTAQAGHAIGGRHNAVLLDEEIIRVQCCGCNIFKRGNYQVFITKLIQENGLDWWLAKLAASKLTIKYSRVDLEAKIESYKARLAGVS
jgi:hypothetical protein